jgi:tetratricopeptide (TPR) repeat protein
MFESLIVFSCPENQVPLTQQERDSLKELGIAVAEDFEEAKKLMEKEARCVCVAVCSNPLSSQARKFLVMVGDRFNIIADMQILVNDDPDIATQCLAHEVGIRTYWQREGFVRRLRAWAHDQIDMLNAADHPTGLSIRLGVSLVQKKYKVVTDHLPKIIEDAKWDYRLANILGHYYFARREHEKAEEAFAKAQALNPIFVPSLNGLATVQLNAGKAEQALTTYQKLETVNEFNSERTIWMAHGYADLGNWEKALEFASQGEKLSPGDSRIKEIEARWLFQSGKPDQAIAILEKCAVTSEYYISKLNDEAIKLSRAEQTERAIGVYVRAHTLAPAHIKYKLSFNIALALRREGKIKEALETAKQAQNECMLPNFDKINALIDALTEEGEKK